MLQTAWLLPPTRLLTLGFDPARFQTEPPACYRASWQLPGWDSHPQATTSLCWITIYTSTSNPGHTAEIEQAADPPLARRRAGVRAGHCAGASTAPRCAPLARSGSQPVSTLSPALSARQGRCPSALHRDFAEEPGVSSPLAGRDATSSAKRTSWSRVRRCLPGGKRVSPAIARALRRTAPRCGGLAWPGI